MPLPRTEAELPPPYAHHLPSSPTPHFHPSPYNFFVDPSGRLYTVDSTSHLLTNHSHDPSPPSLPDETEWEDEVATALHISPAVMWVKDGRGQRDERWCESRMEDVECAISSSSSSSSSHSFAVAHMRPVTRDGVTMQPWLGRRLEENGRAERQEEREKMRQHRGGRVGTKGSILRRASLKLRSGAPHLLRARKEPSSQPRPRSSSSSSSSSVGSSSSSSSSSSSFSSSSSSTSDDVSSGSSSSASRRESKSRSTHRPSSSSSSLSSSSSTSSSDSHCLKPSPKQGFGKKRVKGKRAGDDSSDSSSPSTSSTTSSTTSSSLRRGRAHTPSTTELLLTRLSQSGLSLHSHFLDPSLLSLHDTAVDRTSSGLSHILSGLTSASHHTQLPLPSLHPSPSSLSHSLSLSQALQLREVLRKRERTLLSTHEAALEELRRAQQWLQHARECEGEDREDWEGKQEGGGEVALLVPSTLQPYWYERRDVGFRGQLRQYKRTLNDLDRCYYQEECAH